MPITAVILKVGSQAYVYPYKPFAQSDTNLISGYRCDQPLDLLLGLNRRTAQRPVR